MATAQTPASLVTAIRADLGERTAWMAEVQAAVAPGRLNLGDAALEQQVRDAVAAGRVRLRQVNVDYSTTGQGTITGL